MFKSLTDKMQSKFGFSQSGQIVLEYVFLLLIGVTIAAVIVSTVVSRDPNNPGFLIQKWAEIIQFIGDDVPEEPVPPAGP